MRKRGQIIRFVAIALLVLSVWAYVRSAYPPDPVYDGHPLSFWVSGSGPYGSLSVYPSSLDSKAVPYLIATLKKRDAKPWQWLEKIESLLPGWLRNRPLLRGSTVAAEGRYAACNLLGSMGTKSRPAIPQLVLVLQEDEVVWVKAEAAVVLGRIANRDDIEVLNALSAVAKLPSSQNGWLPGTASEALQHLQPPPAAKAGVTNAVVDASSLVAPSVVGR